MNLERKGQRRRSFLQQLRRFPSLYGRAEVFQAVDGRTLDLDAVPAAVVSPAGVQDAREPRDKVLGYVLTRGAIGLACSLHRVLDLIARDKDERHLYLLCEDDAILAPDFSRAFAELRAAVEAHDPWWEVLHVGYNLACTTINPCGRAACASLNRSGSEAACSVGVPGRLFGMYGVVLPPRGARALLSRLFPVSMQVDTELSRVYQHLKKVEGDLHTRVFSSEPADGAPLRVFAPRSTPMDAAPRPAQRRWPGPIVVAPSSTADNTDIQVLDGRNHAQQYSG